MGFLGEAVIKPEYGCDKHAERGMALISALMAMTLVLALGMAIVFSATTDTITSRMARQGEQAFFVADAGVGIARRALAQALQDQLATMQAGLNASPQTFNPYSLTTVTNQFPDVMLLPDPDTTAGQSSTFYQTVLTNARAIANSNTTRNSRLDALNGTSFTVSYDGLSGSLSLVKSSATQATQTLVFRYSLHVTGKTAGGGTATVNESGRLSTNIVLTVPSAAAMRNFSFSGFGAFFDYGDTQAAAPLASGTFTGPVHTNTHFAFLSSRQVAFRNVVSQVDSQIRYDDLTTTNPNRAIPTADITGIDISAEGYQRVARVPLPTNDFSQEYSVINSTGITDLGSDGLPVDKPAAMPTSPATVFDSAGRVTANTLALNLRGVSGTAPTISSGTIANGVYVSSTDGTSISSKGAGIYVQGNASDIQLYADTNGDQVYVITQGSTITTIRTSYTNNNTVISSGSTTRTLTGVFKDRADPTNVQNGAMLFVNGSISSLRGGKDSSNNRAAVSSATRLTITAQADITITGELKYANPVANSDGTPVSGIGSITNVLGIFTNDGNVNLAPSATNLSGSGLSLEMNAAVVAFNSNTSNDSGAIKGSIVFTGSTTPGGTDRWKLVGSRVQSNINSIGYTYRDIYFDSRFSGGHFAPPFFPGTTYALAPGPASTDLTCASVATPAATAMSWFRDSN
jgi:hypothetical protein